MSDARLRNRVLGWLGGAVSLSMLVLWWSDARASGERVSPDAEATSISESEEALVGAEDRLAIERAEVPRRVEEGADAPDSKAVAEPPAAEPCLLLGSVRDTRGFPVELDRVEILVRAPGSREEEPVEELGPGRFCVRGSKEGSWSVRTRSRDFFHWRDRVRVESGGGPYEVDIVLEPCLGFDVFLTTASGDPVPRPVLGLFEDPSFVRVSAGSSCDETSLGSLMFYRDKELRGQPVRLGFVRMDPLGGERGCVALRVGSEIVDTRTAESGMDSVTFVLTDPGSLMPASVSLRVIGELSGLPPTSTFVMIQTPGAGTTRTGQFGASGYGLLDELPPGLVRLDLSAAKHADRELQVRLQPGEHRDLGDVVLAEPRPIRVRVVGVDGVPVADPEVRAVPLPWTPSYREGYTRYTAQDPDEPDVVSLLMDDGGAAVWTEHEGFRSRPVHARPGNEVVLRLEEPSFETNLTLRGADGSTWWLIDAGGLPAAQGWVPSTREASMLVLPGSYTVHVVESSGATSSFPVTFEDP